MFSLNSEIADDEKGTIDFAVMMFLAIHQPSNIFMLKNNPVTYDSTNFLQQKLDNSH